MQRLLSVAAVVVLLAGPLAPGAARGEVRGLSLTPSTLSVGMFSRGAGLRITGRAPVGSETVIVVRGGDVRESFSRKVRFGLVWVAGGKVEVWAVPGSFVSISPRPIAAILERSAIDRYVLDERALVAGMRVSPPEADRPEIRDAFLQLKVDEGTYRSVTREFDLAPPLDGEVAFTVTLPWPATAPPGRYRVVVHECRDRAVVASSSAWLDVREAGLAAGLKRLAEEQGALYGAVAVGITLSVGFGLDMSLAWVRRRRRRGRQRRNAPTVREDLGVH